MNSEELNFLNRKVFLQVQFLMNQICNEPAISNVSYKESNFKVEYYLIYKIRCSTIL